MYAMLESESKSKFYLQLLLAMGSAATGMPGPIFIH